MGFNENISVLEYSSSLIKKTKERKIGSISRKCQRKEKEQDIIILQKEKRTTRDMRLNEVHGHHKEI